MRIPIDIMINMASVVIAGHTVPKPAHMGAKAWIEFWEAVCDLEGLTEIAEEEVASKLNHLESENEALREQIAKLENADAT